MKILLCRWPGWDVAVELRRYSCGCRNFIVHIPGLRLVVAWGTCVADVR